MAWSEYRGFLLERPRTGKLATVRPDGRPHLAPIWFDLDGDSFIFTTWHTSVKAANLRHDPRVAICVDDDAPPFAFVIVEGVATVEEQADDLLYWATRIAGRYMGAELADLYGRRNAVAGEWLVRVRPTKVVARKGISD
ncbi:MAG: PPOX class F420-dependent oxidoreductase [Chloroflexota bacterium]